MTVIPGIPSSVPNGASAASSGQLPFADGAGGYGWNLQNRGAVTYSTAYSPGDSVLYYGERILITTALTTGAGTNGSGQPFISATKYLKLSSLGWFFASDYGVVADAATDDWTALQTLLLLARSLSTSSNNGYTVVLPSGQVMLSKTLIIPTQTKLLGQGFYSTVLKVLPGSNCDVVQPEQFNSAAQYALISALPGAPANQGALRNAFRWQLRDLTIHGNSANQSVTDYHHGLNAQTNPLTSTGTGDPDFDPAALVSNVQFRSCTGDGFFANGRSGLRLEKCIAWFNRGNGFTPSFDTQLDACQSGFNGIAGFYLNHGSMQGSACKSYNNGGNLGTAGVWWWTSGTTYAAGAYAATATGLYYTAGGVVNSTVDPGTDTGNWTAISAVTSPQAWGSGVYADSNTSEVTLQCDCQQNSASNWYVRSTLGGLNLHGTSHQPNFGGGNNSTSANTTTNTNSYAHLTLDNAAGVSASLGVTAPSAGGATSAYVLRLINGSVRNDVRLAGDTNGTLLSPDSSTLAGSTNRVSYNGTNYSQTISALNDVTLSSPSDTQVLAYNAGTGKWQNTSAAGASVYSGAFGTGVDGALTLDGSTRPPSPSAGYSFPTNAPAASTYTLLRDLHCTTLTINSGVTLLTAGYRIFCQGTLTNNGTISNDGNAGNANGTAGAATASGTIGVGSAGGAGNTGVGTAGTGSGNNNAAIGGGASGAGGLGSNGAGGGQAFIANTVTWPYAQPASVLAGGLGYTGSVRAPGGGVGGGGGGGDATNKGGGGGGGGGIIAIFAHTMINSATGTISAKAGAGGTPTTGNCGGGGGGGGGLILIYTLSAWTNSGTTSVAAGTHGTGVGTGANGVDGNAGSVTNFVIV